MLEYTESFGLHGHKSVNLFNLLFFVTSVFLIFIHLGFNVTFNSVQVISRRVVLYTEETNTYSWSGL